MAERHRSIEGVVLEPNQHKVFVKVRADHELDGMIRPLMFRPEDGAAAKIDRILEYYLAPGRNGNLWDNWQWLEGIPDTNIYMLGVLAAHGQDGIPQVTRYFEEHFPSTTVLNSAPGWCDVNVGVTTKATPFPEFLAAEGFTPDEVVFFCDSENDIELMKLVPNSVCVANAMPAAAELARYTVPADVEDGPAQLMEALAKTGGDLEAAIALLG